MALKRLTIIVWFCALCYLEPGLTSWNIPAPLMLVPKQWGSTPSISLDLFSALNQFVQQLMVKQHVDHEGRKRVKVAPVRPTVVQPCSKELKLFTGGQGKETDYLLLEKGHRENILAFTGKRDGVLMRIRVSQTTNSQGHQVERAEEAPLQRTAETDAVFRLEKEMKRYGVIVWVISFHRVCLLVTMGLLARITVQILLQKTELCGGQKEWGLPESCFSTLIQSKPGPHAASTRRRRKGKRSCKGC